MKRQPLTQTGLLEAARHHLARFPTTRKNLERVLMRRLYRAKRRGEEVPAEAAQWVQDALVEMERVGMLNDALFARLRVSSLRGAGASARAIRGKLRVQGVDPEEVNGLLASEEDGRELVAARRYLQRRRLGPYSRVEHADPNKALAALARAGFSFDVAKQAMSPPEADLGEADFLSGPQGDSLDGPGGPL